MRKEKKETSLNYPGRAMRSSLIIKTLAIKEKQITTKQKENQQLLNFMTQTKTQCSKIA